ncbi:hypothetical protein V5O48_010201 [Marasmius crinis-equi]|uniref:Uncharacterized protein n=1 Tax=Marasmius crinis-equi TaxID=585013 RepID=A0ABR3F9I5_9AGAR
MELLQTTENFYRDPAAPQHECVCGGKEDRMLEIMAWFSSLKHHTKHLVNNILDAGRDLNSTQTQDHHSIPPDSSAPWSRPTSPFRSLSLQTSNPKNDPGSTPLEPNKPAQKPARGDDKMLPPLDRPSKYLCSRCPLCFGGADFELNLDAIVCINACFMQKHNRGMDKDPDKTHLESVFMPEGEVEVMEEIVESIHPHKPRAKQAGEEVEEVVEEDEDV